MTATGLRYDYRVHVDGLTFRVRGSGGSGDSSSPVYVLVHGIGASHRYFQRLHDELAITSEVYSIDIPGFGGLPKPNIAPTVFGVAAALGTVVERLHVQNVVLIGHSMGAQWVVETAVLHPGLTSAVVIIGPVADERHRTLPAQSAALFRDVLGETPAVNAVVMIDYLRCGPSWFLRETKPMLSYPIERRVPLLNVPLLVIRGGKDPIAGIRWCRQLRDAARWGRLVVVPGHHHVVQFTAARTVRSAIHSFAGNSVRAQK